MKTWRRLLSFLGVRYYPSCAMNKRSQCRLLFRNVQTGRVEEHDAGRLRQHQRVRRRAALLMPLLPSGTVFPPLFLCSFAAVQVHLPQFSSLPPDHVFVEIAHFSTARLPAAEL